MFYYPTQMEIFLSPSPISVPLSLRGFYRFMTSQHFYFDVFMGVQKAATTEATTSYTVALMACVDP